MLDSLLLTEWHVHQKGKRTLHQLIFVNALTLEKYVDLKSLGTSTWNSKVKLRKWSNIKYKENKPRGPRNRCLSSPTLSIFFSLWKLCRPIAATINQTAPFHFKVSYLGELFQCPIEHVGIKWNQASFKKINHLDHTLLCITTILNYNFQRAGENHYVERNIPLSLKTWTPSSHTDSVLTPCTSISSWEKMKTLRGAISWDYCEY